VDVSYLLRGRAVRGPPRGVGCGQDLVEIIKLRPRSVAERHDRKIPPRCAPNYCTCPCLQFVSGSSIHLYFIVMYYEVGGEFLRRALFIVQMYGR
jgi:hypothetical protein